MKTIIELLVIIILSPIAISIVKIYLEYIRKIKLLLKDKNIDIIKYIEQKTKK